MVNRETAGLIQQQLAINRLVVPEGKTGECPPVVVRKVFYTFLNLMYEAWIIDLNFVYTVYKNTPKCKISMGKNLMRREHLIIKLQ